MDNILGEIYVIIGRTLSKAAYIEQRMNKFISRKYIPESPGALTEEVLEHEYFSFELKKRIMGALINKHHPECTFPQGQLTQLQK